jgi:hypothetical protein
MRSALGRKWPASAVIAKLCPRPVAADWSGEVRGWIASRGIDPGSEAVVQRGTPGLYRKYIALILDEHGNPAGVIKCSDMPDSIDSIRNECVALNELNDTTGGGIRMPSVLGLLERQDRVIALQSPCFPGPRARRAWSDLHHEFCVRLHASTFRVDAAASAQAIARRERIRQRVSQSPLSGRLPDVCARLLEHALKCIPLERISLGYVHRDLTPWNCFLDDGALTVLDWEWADRHWTPLHDYFHFHVFPDLLRNRAALASWLDFERCPSLVRLAGACGISSGMDAYAALYLYDLILFYADAVSREQGKDLSDPLLLRQVSRAEEWLEQWSNARW